MGCLTKREEFEKQVLSYCGDLYSIAMRYVRNEKDAEDLVQETLMRALAAWESFQRGTNCRAWLLRILTNSFINEYRKLRKERDWVGRDEPIISPARRYAAKDPEGAIHSGLIGDEVFEALTRLPMEFREVVVLADLDGMSYKEISRAIGCPLGTVMSRLHRARRLLETSLSGYAKEMGIGRALAAA